MPDAEKILVRSVNWLGDAIMATPALQRLREARPAAHLALLTPQKLAGLWQGQPFLNEVLTFGPEENVWRVGRRLRQKKFDVGLAFPNSVRSALELWLAGIPRRIGFKRGLRGFLLTRAVSRRSEEVPMVKRSDAEIHRLIARNASPVAIAPTAHHIHDYLTLTAQLGAATSPLPPRIWVTDEATTQLAQRWALDAKEEEPWFGLNPGAEYGPAKRWPAERFAAAAIAAQKQTRCRWLIFGGVADQNVAGEIVSAIQQEDSRSDAVLNLAGQTNLTELAAAIKICRLLLTNDTGPMHLAAAVGTPVVAIFGSTSPELTGPIFSPMAQIVCHPVPCAPCFRRVCPIDLRCLNGIDAPPVIEAVLRILAHS